MCCSEKSYLYQFIPREFEYLIQTKKIPYKGINLKTDYLINIMHELILRFYFTNENIHNLYSGILREKYGKHYNYYIEYLVEIKFMFMISNYYVGKKAKTFKLNITDLDNIRCKVTDPVLLKKHSKDYLYQNFTSKQNSPIDPELRKILIDDLYHVEIDFEKAKDYLNKAKSSKEIDLSKYLKNMSSIDGISSGHIFFKFDEYGRLHTNYTVLKKWVRQNCLTIDGKETMEMDIPNSQPLFFTHILNDEIGKENFNDEVKGFVDCCKNGLIYDKLVSTFPKKLKTRCDAKILMYKVLFGDNKSNTENKLFKSIYPTVYEYIKDLKTASGDYKSISHRLMKMESQTIYNNIVKDIKDKFPHIKLFTVHDSIVFPTMYKEEVGIIFRNHMKKIK